MRLFSRQPDDPLPGFRFFEDPVREGVVEARKIRCSCCGKKRSHVYTGPQYGPSDDVEPLCPWCIADGSAAEELGLSFNECIDIPDGADADLIEEVEERTPAYQSWQGSYWAFLADTPMVFVGEATLDMVTHPDRSAIEAAFDQEASVYGFSEDDPDRPQLSTQVRGGHICFYIFRDPETGRYTARSDCD